MSHRGARVTDFEERDYYAAPPRRSAADFDEVEYRASRVLTRSPPPRPRSRSHVRESRGTAFLREDVRRTEGGPMVLRQRDVEVVDRHRRSPSPARLREDRILSRPRSVSPSTVREEHERVKFVERERVRSPSLVRRSEPEPRPVRFVERRPRSPSPTTREHIRTRIVERETERSPSTSPSPSPPPIIRGPTIERDVITHYTDVDHGMPSRRRHVREGAALTDACQAS
ncbi:hypothetical protein DCS_04959 [Drechmeria coniospora]|uniref:Uncharacterized protein n=1 Tax=Drechmeria coniospora TaxID=98403 RepID=A0A151GLH8_DRECN|nr:hypothetical protein DCS_04959 [Drechmeria coniospora]KYK57946.1 hypothetical protein DCS_04959 [Drechmeria coniospora]